VNHYSITVPTLVPEHVEVIEHQLHSRQTKSLPRIQPRVRQRDGDAKQVATRVLAVAVPVHTGTQVCCPTFCLLCNVTYRTALGCFASN